MSYEYNLYLNEHKMNVMGAFHWLCKNVFNDWSENIKEYHLNWAANNIAKHDETKYSSAEYKPYDWYFYGDERYSTKNQPIEDIFNVAWLHHIHNNPHHWQHWVLVNDDPELGTIGLEMPLEYVIEMICDWWSFSWKNGNLYEIFNWYEKNKHHMILHENTRKEVEYILKKMRVKLDETIAEVMAEYEEEDKFDDDRR